MPDALTAARIRRCDSLVKVFEVPDIVEDLEGEVVADLLGRGLRRDLGRELLGVGNVELPGISSAGGRHYENDPARGL